MDKRTKKRDTIRRYTRRGIARCVLENDGNNDYFNTHEMADDYRRSYSKKKLSLWANERDLSSGTGTAVFGMQIDPTNPKSAKWPR